MQSPMHAILLRAGLASVSLSALALSHLGCVEPSLNCSSSEVVVCDENDDRCLCARKCPYGSGSSYCDTGESCHSLGEIGSDSEAICLPTDWP
jgi:hypothetical protein